jgi:hypothetical protein
MGRAQFHPGRLVVHHPGNRCSPVGGADRQSAGGNGRQVPPCCCRGFGGATMTPPREPHDNSHSTLPLLLIVGSKWSRKGKCSANYKRTVATRVRQNTYVPVENSQVHFYGPLGINPNSQSRNRASATTGTIASVRRASDRNRIAQKPLYNSHRIAAKHNHCKISLASIQFTATTSTHSPIRGAQ